MRKASRNVCFFCGTKNKRAREKLGGSRRIPNCSTWNNLNLVSFVWFKLLENKLHIGCPEEPLLNIMFHVEHYARKALRKI